MSELRQANVCRLCAATGNADMIEIFHCTDHESLPAKIASCTSLVVQESDHLPKRICPVCVYLVEKSYVFRNMCRRTDTKLRSARGKQNYRKVLSLDMSQSDEDKDEECFLKAYEKAALQQNVNRAIEVERHKWISDIKRDIIKVLDGASNDHPTITKTEAESAELLLTEDRHMQSVSIADADIVYTITEDCTIATQDDNSTQFLLESEEQVPSSTPREHMCNVCGKSFSKKGVLNRHARIHAQEKRFVCGVCGRGFVQNETLKRHQYKHSVVKPFPCRFCAKAFIERSLLRSHIEKEHNSGSGHYAAPVRLPCKLCLKTFLHKSGLSRHLQTHSGVTYKCNHCSKTFVDYSSRARHIKSLHPDVDYER